MRTGIFPFRRCPALYFSGTFFAISSQALHRVVRVVAGGTFDVRVMLVRIDAPDLRSRTCRIGQREMTAQAVRPALVDDQLGTLLGRMFADGIVRRAMAVLALNDRVRRVLDLVVLVGMAVFAVLLPQVLHLEFF